MTFEPLGTRVAVKVEEIQTKTIGIWDCWVLNWTH